MGSDPFHHYKKAIQDSLNTLARSKKGLSGAEEQRLSEAIDRLSATVKSLGKEHNPASSLSSDFRSPSHSDFQPVENILNLVPDSHVITSPEGLIQMANLQAAQLLHRAQEALVGVPVSQFVSESDRSVIRDHLKKLKQGAANWEWAMRIAPPDRFSSLVSCRISAIRDPAGNLLAVHWLFRDFTEQQRADLTEELVQATGEQVLSGLTLDQTVRLVCRRFVETFHYPLIWIGTKEQDGTIKVRAFAGEISHGLDYYQEWWKGPMEQQGGAAKAIQDNATQDLDEHDIARTGMGILVRRQGIQAGLAIPLAIRNQVLGVLNVYAHQRQMFDAGVIQWLERLAAQISLVLFLAHDYDHLRLQGAAVSSAEHAVCIMNPDGCIEWINEAYCRLTGYRAAEVIGTRLPSFPSGRAATRLKRLTPPLPQGQYWRSESVEKRKDGSVYTVEQVLTPLMNERGQVTNFVSILQDITTRKEVEAQMLYRVHHDPLTDLPNRVMFQDRLTQALARGRRQDRLVSVMFLDLDGFKQINDEYGHGTGDRLLKVVATRLTQCVRATDTVARLSGDEFTLILEDLERLQDIHRVVHKILDLVVQPVLLEGQCLSVKTSVGISIFPLDGTDPELLLQCADRAMYKAKARGGQCCHFASEGINQQFVQNPVGKSESGFH